MRAGLFAAKTAGDKCRVLHRRGTFLSVRANMTLTDRQQQILTFISSAQQKTGVTPSTREIQRHFGFASQTAAVNHLRALERKGVLRRHAGKARAMALVSTLQRDPILDIPIYGSIAAGLSEFNEESRDGVLSIDARTAGLRGSAGTFALKVRGDSMIGAQINDGDLVVLEARPPQITTSSRH